MTFEFKNIVDAALQAQSKGLKSVLASVVALDGSSYRKPGVRMLILENGTMVGAVSGGCVEKEILLQSETVFKTGKAKMMTYDGRYRLGCEGILYILIEPFSPNVHFVDAFYKCMENRNEFEIQSYFEKKAGIISAIGTHVKINKEKFSISGKHIQNQQNILSVFKQNMPPCFKLVIIGVEHDAVQLCKYATLTGWEVTIVSGLSEAKTISDFPGAKHLYAISPEQLDTKMIDSQTAIVLMTHNFATDLRYLVSIKNTNPSYIGVLGPSKRREDLLSQCIEYCPNIDAGFLDKIHGPAGLDIGSVTPQEIAVSIISEILAFTNKREAKPLSKVNSKVNSD